jgi:predicted transcriptional regulator
MNFLLEKKLLEVKSGNPTGNVYCTTEKGKKLLECIKNELGMVS